MSVMSSTSDNAECKPEFVDVGQCDGEPLSDLGFPKL